MRVVMCGPYPADEAERAAGDGLMQCVVTLSHALAQLPGVEMHVLSRSRGVAATRTADVNGVRVTWVRDGATRLDWLVGRRMLRGAFARVLRETGPDIVHAHGEAPFIRAALDHPAPHVVTLHGIFALQTRAHGRRVPPSLRVAYALMRRWERGYLPRIGNLIAINDAIADYVRPRAPRAAIYRINNPVNPLFFGAARRESPHPTVLFVGQLSRRKGLHVLLEAFAELRARRPNAELRVAGDDGQDASYAAELRRHGAAVGGVTFLGPRQHQEIAAELERAWLLCLPSRYEASPLVVIEAMAAGVPVVATRSGDTPELLRDGAGVVTPPDDPVALADAIDGFLRDAGARRAAGERARAAAERRASPDAIARETLSVYRACVSAPASAAASPRSSGVLRAAE